MKNKKKNSKKLKDRIGIDLENLNINNINDVRELITKLDYFQESTFVINYYDDFDYEELLLLKQNYQDLLQKIIDLEELLRQGKEVLNMEYSILNRYLYEKYEKDKNY